MGFTKDFVAGLSQGLNTHGHREESVGSTKRMMENWLAADEDAIEILKVKYWELVHSNDISSAYLLAHSIFYLQSHWPNRIRA